MNRTHFKALYLFNFFIFLFSIQSVIGQMKEVVLDSAFQKYTDVYRENVYVHFNKTKFLKGEEIGFTAYVFHKQTKMLSDFSKNLYCVITNEQDSIVKQKMIKVSQGIAHNSFKIDEKFNDGIYTLKAYTNWMLNFPNQIFQDSFEVIDGATNAYVEKTKRSKSLDIQLLPESGHFLHGVRNTVGIVVKDSLNYGIPNLTGEIRTEKNELISDFKLNKFGISRFSFQPEHGKKYKAVLNYQDSVIQKKITEEINQNGILLKVAEYGKVCVVQIETNTETLEKIKNNPYTLTFHDGSRLQKIPVSFQSGRLITKKIPLANLNTGINVFTLFDGEDKPIAERLFFNYENLKIWKSKISSINRNDSVINLNLKYSDFAKKNYNNISISVLPKETKAYQKNSNVIAQALLKPFVNGKIENAGYYFKKINKRVKYDLDNLLITQGWSSYDWSLIFNYEYDKKFLFENGIAIRIAIPKREKDRKFMIHGNANRSSQVVTLDKSDRNFSLNGYFPYEDEKIAISRINRNGNLKTTTLDLEFFPNTIPKLNSTSEILKPKEDYYALELFADANWFKSENKGELLDEIFLTTNIEKQRQEKIKKKLFGKVHFIEESDARYTLVDFLNKQPGLRAYDDYTLGQIVVLNNFQKLSGGDSVPAYFIDDVEVTPDLLFRYWMDDVDYVEISNFGTGKNIRANKFMSINIFTKKEKKGKPTVSKFKFPLTFSTPKKFYIPKYENYDSSFFRQYGVIDWLPINKIDENGIASIAINYNKNEDIKLFIEGVTADGEYIFEEKEIVFKKR